MHDFPETTFFNRNIPKTKFYQNLELKPAVRNVFVNEIEKIVWRNKLSPATLNVQSGTRVQEIEVLEITLKKENLSEAALKVIDKGIPYHILFLLKHDDLYLACMGYKDLETKSISEYYKTGWMSFDELPIKIDGLSLEEVYDNFVRQINITLASGSLKDAITDDIRQKQIAREHKFMPNGEILLYQAADGTAKLNVRLVNETIWLTQKEMAELFAVDRSVISRHLKNIFAENELNKEVVCAEFAQPTPHGAIQGKIQIQTPLFYNLDAIISVGYRVNSRRATQFRIWATGILKEYISKGFVLDDERLKNPPIGDNEVPDPFDDLLERIRDIRASERRMYLRVREIFSMAADYRVGYKETTQFFSFIQDKLHLAATGHTASELIVIRANHLLPDMGLTNYPQKDVRKADTTIAKNYLNEIEITELNRIVTMWLDYAEDQATRRKQIFLQDWTDKLDDFLRFNDRPVLENHGKVSRETANEHAHREYKLFAAKRRELKEAEGERLLEQELKDIAKKLPLRKRK